MDHGAQRRAIERATALLLSSALIPLLMRCSVRLQLVDAPTEDRKIVQDFIKAFRAKYGADLILPGMLFARVLRSPHAHARIKSIDTSAAEALPGVKAVITGKDFPDQPKSKPPSTGCARRASRRPPKSPTASQPKALSL